MAAVQVALLLIQCAPSAPLSNAYSAVSITMSIAQTLASSARTTTQTASSAHPEICAPNAFLRNFQGTASVNFAHFWIRIVSNAIMMASAPNALTLHSSMRTVSATHAANSMMVAANAQASITALNASLQSSILIIIFAVVAGCSMGSASSALLTSTAKNVSQMNISSMLTTFASPAFPPSLDARNALMPIHALFA